MRCAVRLIAGIGCVASLVAGCAYLAPAPAPTAAEATPPGFPGAHYRTAAASGKAVYEVDPAASLLVIEVRRSGSLARLGHDHVVSSRAVRGFLSPAEGRADGYVPVARLEVDEPGLRTEAGFDTVPSPSDVAATRSNMLDYVLEAERHPFVLIHVDRADPAARTTGVDLTLRGVRRRIDVPVRIERDGERIVVTGSATILQSDFGIVPYSILGGAIAVRDRVDLRFHIVAVPFRPPG